MFTKENIDTYARILFRVFPEEVTSIQKEKEELEKYVDDQTITASLEPTDSAAREVINRLLAKTQKELHRMPAHWEIRRFLNSSEYQKCTNQEVQESIDEIFCRHTQNIEKVQPQDYLRHHREDVELLFEKLVDLNTEEQTRLKESLDRQFANQELEGVFRHKGIFDSFSGTYAFSFKLPLNAHPIHFYMALRTLVWTYLPQTDEGLLWRHPLSGSLWSQTKDAVKELIHEHTK